MRLTYLHYHYQHYPVQHPDLSYLQAVTNLLHPVDFTQYRAVDAMMHQVTLLYSTIGEYVHELGQIATLMEAGELVEPERLQTKPRTVSLDHWLTVSHGVYVHPVDAVAEFRDAVVRLLRVSLKHQNTKVGVQAANRRVLRNFFLDLETLTHSLVSFAVQ